MSDDYYRRKLPHIQPAEATFFVTFRLAGSIPMEVIRRIKENYALVEQGILSQNDLTEKERRELVYGAKKRLFATKDEFMDTNPNGPYWLREPAVAEVVAGAMRFYDQKHYDLLSYCIMPNHVHMMMTLLPAAPKLFKIMQNLKRYTALNANKLLDRGGAFWEEEYYDHLVRSEEELYRILNYILRNPEKAGFVQNWQEWPFTYAKPELL